MCNVILVGSNQQQVRAQVVNGQEGLYANGQTTHDIELNVVRTGGFGTGSPLRLEFRFQEEGKPDKYVTLHGESVVLDATGATEGRLFQVIWTGCDEFALLASNGKYVTRGGEEPFKLFANRDAIGEWERFKIDVI